MWVLVLIYSVGKGINAMVFVIDDCGAVITLALYSVRNYISRELNKDIPCDGKKLPITMAFSTSSTRGIYSQ